MYLRERRAVVRERRPDDRRGCTRKSAADGEGSTGDRSQPATTWDGVPGSELRVESAGCRPRLPAASPRSHRVDRHRGQARVGGRRDDGLHLRRQLERVGQHVAPELGQRSNAGVTMRLTITTPAGSAAGRRGRPVGHLLRQRRQRRRLDTSVARTAPSCDGERRPRRHVGGPTPRSDGTRSAGACGANPAAVSAAPAAGRRPASRASPHPREPGRAPVGVFPNFSTGSGAGARGATSFGSSLPAGRSGTGTPAVVPAAAVHCAAVELPLGWERPASRAWVDGRVSWAGSRLE